MFLLFLKIVIKCIIGLSITLGIINAIEFYYDRQFKKTRKTNDDSDNLVFIVFGILIALGCYFVGDKIISIVY